jgi:hypothetical protein
LQQINILGTFWFLLKPFLNRVLGIQLRHKNTAPNSGVEKTMKLYNNILLQEIKKGKTSFTPQG